MLKKYAKDDWSKYDSCGNCADLYLTERNRGVCTNSESEHYEKRMPCWYGCEKWKYRWGWIDGKGE